MALKVKAVERLLKFDKETVAAIRQCLPTVMMNPTMAISC